MQFIFTSFSFANLLLAILLPRRASSVTSNNLQNTIFTPLSSNNSFRFSALIQFPPVATDGITTENLLYPKNKVPQRPLLQNRDICKTVHTYTRVQLLLQMGYICVSKAPNTFFMNVVPRLCRVLGTRMLPWLKQQRYMCRIHCCSIVLGQSQMSWFSQKIIQFFN